MKTWDFENLSGRGAESVVRLSGFQFFRFSVFRPELNRLTRRHAAFTYASMRYGKLAGDRICVQRGWARTWNPENLKSWPAGSKVRLSVFQIPGVGVKT